MPIRPFLAGRAFEPEAIREMSLALETVCGKLGLSLGDDPSTRGVRDAPTLSAMTLKERNSIQAGTEILVANVVEMNLDNISAKDRARRRNNSGKSGAIAARVEVDKSARAVRVFSKDGKLLAFYPASIGSSEKPAPSSKFAVRSVNLNPTYHYNPKYGFKGQKANRPVTVPAGPDNPVRFS